MKKKKIIWCLLLFVFCSNLVYSANWKAKHVVLIVLDGWGSYSMPEADMPNVKQLIKEGSCTLQKRAVFPSASTENWSSMFMGVGPELHGFYTDGGYSWRKPLIEPRVLNKDGVFPTIFSIFHEAYPKAEIGIIYQWEAIKNFVDTVAVNYCKQVPMEEPLMIDIAVDYITKNKPDLLMVGWDNPDETGHEYGWYSDKYYDELKILDNNIGQVIKALKESGMWDDTIIMITSDHGGTGRGHGGLTTMEMNTPFVICGKDIKKNYEIKGSMMQYDVASTIASIFNLKQPQVWVGKPISEIFIK